MSSSKYTPRIQLTQTLLTLSKVRCCLSIKPTLHDCELLPDCQSVSEATCSPSNRSGFHCYVSVNNLMILITSNEGHEYLPISVVLTSRENEKKKDWNWRLSWKCKGRWCHSAMRSMLNLKKQFDWCAIPTCAGNVVSEESKLNRCVFLDFAPKKFESLPTLFLISHLFCFCSLIANSYLNVNLAKKRIMTPSI